MIFYVLGERPFLCKICNMSFTTNGNMHRHSRIHAKDGSGSPALKDSSSSHSSGKKSDDQLSIGSSGGSSRKRQSMDIPTASLSNTKRRLYDEETNQIRYPLQQTTQLVPTNLYGAQTFPNLGWPLDIPLTSEEVSYYTIRCVYVLI